MLQLDEIPYPERLQAVAECIQEYRAIIGRQRPSRRAPGRPEIHRDGVPPFARACIFELNQ
jgi:hypothetical protein